MMKLSRKTLLVAIGMVVAQLAQAATYDVVVVGATPAGVAAAVNAAREGVTVALVEETGHIGGLASGGLSNTDFKTFASLGGTFLEFTHRVEQYYIRTYGPDSQQVIDCVRGAYYEPKVARKVFEEMLAEQNRITVMLHRRIAGAEVKPSGGIRRLRSIEVLDVRGGTRTTLQAKVFIDATYEGDLVGAAGVPYRLGCESRHEYNEDAAEFEESNRYVQSYNFRVCLSRDPANRLEIPRPASYNEAEYLPILGHIRSGIIKSFSNPGSNPILKVRPIPNLKADFNDIGAAPISLSLKNVNHEWPEGGPEVRRRIFQRYKDHSLGLFWFLANHPEVPEEFRNQMREWGLSKDEYTDTENWTPALYVREGRRIVGEYVFTQHDTQPAAGGGRARLHRDSVAIGDYGLNCHGVFTPAPGRPAPKITPSASSISLPWNIGRIGRSVRPFQMPYRIMVPVEMDALLVPVAVSASHVGYSAIRMEPAWTALGQAAGLAAAMSVKEGVEARALDVARLQRRLHELGAMTIYVPDLDPERRVPKPAWDPPGHFSARIPSWTERSRYFQAVQYFGTRGFFHDLAGSEGIRPAGPNVATGQWRIAITGHDAGLSRPIDPALAARWLGLAGANPRADLVADGRLTRGEFLHRLHSLQMAR
jgi:hypothetical protein